MGARILAENLKAEAKAEIKVVLLGSGLPQPLPANPGSLDLDDFLGYKVQGRLLPSRALQAVWQGSGDIQLPRSEASLPVLLSQVGDTSWTFGN